MASPVKYYEFVLIFDPTVQNSLIESTLSDIESAFPQGAIQKKDVIGILPTAYPLKKGLGENKAYYVSYYLHMDAASVVTIKKHIAFMNIIIRSVFYAMTAKQPYYTYEETQKKMKELFTDEKIAHI